jgi:hypothetical protein
MKKLLKHRRSLQLIALVLVTLLLFGTTEVTKVPSFMIIVGFVTVSLIFYSVFYAFLSLASLYGLTIRRKRSLSIYLTLVSGSLIALQSIGALGMRETVVALPLALLGYVYSVYAKSSKSL